MVRIQDEIIVSLPLWCHPILIVWRRSITVFGKSKIPKFLVISFQIPIVKKHPNNMWVVVSIWKLQRPHIETIFQSLFLRFSSQEFFLDKSPNREGWRWKYEILPYQLCPIQCIFLLQKNSWASFVVKISLLEWIQT